MNDDSGQISLEYLLIFTVSLIILIAFTMPLLEKTMDNTFDVSDSIKAKSDLSKLSQAIKRVYAQGQGSSVSVNLDLKTPVKITVGNNYVSSKIKLKNNEYKRINIETNSKIKTTSIDLAKGNNRLIIDWPENSEYMTIYQK